MTIIASGRGWHSESIGMTKENPSAQTQLDGEEFVSKIEELLNNEAVSKIDVTYYVETGGCIMKAFVGNSKKEYYTPKSPGKIGRFTGEMEWVTSDRNDFEVSRSQSQGWSEYSIKRLDTEEGSLPSETPLAERDVYFPKVITNFTSGQIKQQNALEIIIHELAQEQVESVLLRPESTNHPSASIQITALDNDSLIHTYTSEFEIQQDSLEKAIHYIRFNTKYFEARFCVTVKISEDETGEVTAVAFDRLEEMEGLSHANRANYLDNRIFINDYREYWNVESFLEWHLSNEDVTSVVACKQNGNAYYKIDVQVEKYCTVEYYLSDNDFEELNTYLSKNSYEIQWNGFDVIRPECEEGAVIEDCVKIFRTASAEIEDGRLVALNLPLFVHEYLTNPKGYQLHFGIGRYNASILTVDTTGKIRDTFFVKAAVEEAKDFLKWLKANESEFQSLYGVNFEHPENTTWEQALKIEKNVRYSWDYYTDENSIPQEAIYLLDKAYTSGAGLIITGLPGVGKNCFINTLAENSKDKSLSIFAGSAAEYEFSEDNENLIRITGEAGSSLNAAVNIKPARIVFDYDDECDKSSFLKRAVQANIQLITTTRGSLKEHYEETKSVVENYPFEIEVQLDFVGKVKAIWQLNDNTNQGFSSTMLWHREGNELVLDSEPSRSLRRRMDGKSVPMKETLTKTVEKTGEASKLIAFSESEVEEIKKAISVLQSVLDRL
jgi:hypothetical protein